MGMVGDFLDSIMGTTKVDSSAQLEAAKKQQHSWTPEQNRQARAQGFQNAQQMYDFNRQKSQRRDTSTTAAGGRIDEAKRNLRTMHPATMLQGVSDALKKANEGQ